MPCLGLTPVFGFPNYGDLAALGRIPRRRRAGHRERIASSSRASRRTPHGALSGRAVPMFVRLSIDKAPHIESGRGKAFRRICRILHFAQRGDGHIITFGHNRDDGPACLVRDRLRSDLEYLGEEVDQPLPSRGDGRIVLGISLRQPAIRELPLARLQQVPDDAPPNLLRRDLPRRQKQLSMGSRCRQRPLRQPICVQLAFSSLLQFWRPSRHRPAALFRRTPVVRSINSSSTDNRPGH
jgi:hypothetical protein